MAPLAGCARKPAPVPPPVPARRFGVILGPGQYTADGKRAFALTILDLDHPARTPRTIPLDFFAHGVVPSPTNPRRALLFQKIGKGSCEVDLVDGTVVQKVTTAAEREFYGHGAFLPDGSRLFSTETIVGGDFKGVIAVRDGKTLELLGTFPTYGSAPHDCRLVDGGKTLVITNGGGNIDGGPRPCVTYVDAATEKLIEKVEFDTPKVNAGHLALTSGGDLAVVSAPREGQPEMLRQKGAVSLRAKGGTLVTMTVPKDITDRLIGEVLSVCVHEPSGIAAATCPLGDLVTFWDLKKGKLVKSMECLKPRGITLTLDGTRYVLSFGNGQVMLLATDSLEPLGTPSFDGTLISGSHIMAYALA